jgi:hypothetical protein
MNTEAVATESGPFCEDSPLKAKYDGKKKTCESIVNKEGCSLKEFWGHCRATCKKCQKCVDSKLKFQVETYDNIKEMIKCKDVKKNPGEYCEFDGVPETCPQSCGVCDGSEVSKNR